MSPTSSAQTMCIIYECFDRATEAAPFIALEMSICAREPKSMRTVLGQTFQIPGETSSMVIYEDRFYSFAYYRSATNGRSRMDLCCTLSGRPEIPRGDY